MAAEALANLSLGEEGGGRRWAPPTFINVEIGNHLLTFPYRGRGFDQSCVALVLRRGLAGWFTYFI